MSAPELSFKVGAIEVEARVPTMDELTPVLRSIIEHKGDVTANHGVLRDLVKTIVSKETYDALTLRKPGAFFALGFSIVGSLGFGKPVNFLSDEEVDEAFAKVIVEKEETPFIRTMRERYPGEDIGKLYPVSIQVGTDEIRALLQFPLAKQVDMVRDSTSMASYRDFVHALTVWGEIKRLEAEGPFFYFAIAERMLQLAGHGEAELVKKA